MQKGQDWGLITRVHSFLSRVLLVIPIYIWGIAWEELLELKVWFTMRLQGNLSLKISEIAYYQLRNIIFATTISFSKVVKGDSPFFGQLWLSPESTWWTAGIFPGYRTVKTPCCSQQVVPAWPPFWTREVTLVPGLCSRQVACRYRVPRSLHRLQVSRAVAKRRRPALFSLAYL